MRNYRIINDYEIIDRINPYVCNVTVEDLKSNLYYLVWADDHSAICFDRNPSSPEGIGYMRFPGEASVFEEDDIIPYMYS